MQTCMLTSWGWWTPKHWRYISKPCHFAPVTEEHGFHYPRPSQGKTLTSSIWRQRRLLHFILALHLLFHKQIRRDELCNIVFIVISVYLVFYQIIKATEVAGEPFPSSPPQTVLTVLIWLCWNSVIRIYKQSRKLKKKAPWIKIVLSSWNDLSNFLLLKEGNHTLPRGKKKMYYFFSILQMKVRGKQKEKHFSRELCQKWKCKCSFLHWDCRISAQE